MPGQSVERDMVGSGVDIEVRISESREAPRNGMQSLW